MTRKRPETTLYLGEELCEALEEYRLTQPGPPSTSSIVREALRAYLAEVSRPSGLPPRQWVEQTEPLMRYMAKHGSVASNDQIVQALEDAREDRDRALLGDPE